MALEPPHEILDLADGETRTFTVLSVERGDMTFTPRGASSPVTTPAMRLHVDPADKVFGPPYYDTTARTLQAQLGPLLSAPGALPRRITVRKFGAAPSARFSVGFAPAGSGVTA